MRTINKYTVVLGSRGNATKVGRSAAETAKGTDAYPRAGVPVVRQALVPGGHYEAVSTLSQFLSYFLSAIGLLGVFTFILPLINS